MKKLISATMISVLTIQPISAMANEIHHAPIAHANAASMPLEVEASLSIAQREALNMLVLGALIESEVGELGEVPKNIRHKYEMVAKGIPYSPFIIALGIGTGFLAKDSVKEFKSIFDAVTELVKFVGNQSYRSGKSSIDALDPLWDVLEPAFKSSTDVAEATSKVIEAMIKPFMRAELAYSSGSSLTGGILSASVFMTLNSSEEALTNSKVRSILGYNKELKSKIDSVVDRLSGAFNLSPAKAQIAKEKLMNQIIAEGIRTEFNTSEMKIDMASVFKTVLDKDQIEVMNGLDKLFSITTSNSTNTTSVDQINVMIALTAHLEALYETKQLTEKQEKELGARIASANRAIRQIQRNLKIN